MALKQIKKFILGSVPHITRDDAMKIFRRDNFKCQYCGLDGRHVFENWLVLTIDHIHPHAYGGPRRMDNLVTACRPCNLMKGKHVFNSFEDAKEYVRGKRENWRKLYKEETHSGGPDKLHGP